MFFEGSEKKAEVIVNPERFNLLTHFNYRFWETLVYQSGAHILSTTKSNECHAYVLSESSLFVWEDRFLILTCGSTNLVQAVAHFIKEVGADAIKHATFQRKNEHALSDQPSTFIQDATTLKNLLLRHGQNDAYLLGDPFGAHNCLYTFNNGHHAPSDDTTYEYLLSNLSTEASDYLTTPNLTVLELRACLLDDIFFKDWEIDDVVFSPFGYSMNAIHGSLYVTIHVTPQHESSYVSVESNTDIADYIKSLVPILIPQSLDIVSFNGVYSSSPTNCVVNNLTKLNYQPVALTQKTLNSGYNVRYQSYKLSQIGFAEALPLKLEE